MFQYIIRRSLLAIPTLLVISFVIFGLLEIAPGDPTGNLPMTIPQEVREQIRESMGVNDDFHIKYLKWCRQFFYYEPLNLIESAFGIEIGNSENRTRILSWMTRSPVVDIIIDRLPQTILVVGLSYLLGILVAIPIGVISANRQYSIFDQVGTFVSMLGYSVPTFFTGLLMIIIFSSQRDWLPGSPWFPSIYDTTLKVTDWSSFVQQVRQMVMPVFVLTFFNAAQLSRYMRSSMLDNLSQDYARTARSKGVEERQVVWGHVLRNSMIPVITLIALGIPTIFTGAIITEQIFKINGIGEFLIRAIEAGDVPTVQTLTFIFAVLIVFFNIIADICYGLLDPRIRYD